jgi:hypothetical protein
MSELAERETWLVASLIAGAEPPAGFDPASLRAAREALLRKRASLVAHAWPQLAGSLAERWPDEFLGWARAGRRPERCATAGTSPGRWRQRSRCPARAPSSSPCNVTWRYHRTGPPWRRRARRSPDPRRTAVPGRPPHVHRTVVEATVMSG